MMKKQRYQRTGMMALVPASMQNDNIQTDFGGASAQPHSVNRWDPAETLEDDLRGLQHSRDPVLHYTGDSTVQILELTGRLI